MELKEEFLLTKRNYDHIAFRSQLN